MKKSIAMAMTVSLLSISAFCANDPEAGTYQDYVTPEGWLSDVHFKFFTVWPGEYQQKNKGTIKLTFVAKLSSGFGVPVKLDVTRVFVGADGTQHFLLRPVRIPRNELAIEEPEKVYDSRIEVLVPVGLNGPTVYLHAVEADQIATKSVRLPRAKL